MKQVVQSEVLTKATAALESDVAKDLKKEDPLPQVAKAILDKITGGKADDEDTR